MYSVRDRSFLGKHDRPQWNAGALRFSAAKAVTPIPAGSVNPNTAIRAFQGFLHKSRLNLRIPAHSGH